MVMIWTKKVLDKVHNPWYNIRRGNGKGKQNMNNMKELLDGFSPDKDRSIANIEKITIIGNTLRTVVDENFPSLRYPVIAGGAIRDAVFGTKIKDYDIFFDASPFEEDEKADTALLLIALTCEKLAAGPFPGLAESAFSVVGRDADYTLSGKPDGTVSVPFIVYQNYKVTYTEEQVNWDQMVLAPPEPLVEFPSLQMIGHNDNRLTEDPLEFLEYFDYDLVKGLFDPRDMEFHFHRTMLESINKRELKYSGFRTSTRVRSFFDKMRYASADGQKMADSFRVVDETPKAKDPSDYPFTKGLSKESSSLSRLVHQSAMYQLPGRLLREEFPPMWDEQEFVARHQPERNPNHPGLLDDNF